jgi:hypothetical protein
MGKNDRREGESGHDIETCKSIFVPWQWLAITAISLIATVTVFAVYADRRVAKIDNITATEGQQRIQADSALSYRIVELEKHMKHIPADIDSIKNWVRKKP